MADHGKRQTLIDQTLEAEQFLASAERSLTDYKLFPSEDFAFTVTGVLSSTRIDTHGEAFHIDDLRALVERIETSPFWIWREHDPLIHPIGRALTARLFYAPKSKEYFVAGLVGFYDGNKIPKFESLGIDASRSSSSASDKIQVEEPHNNVSLEFDSHDFSPEDVQQILTDAPDYFAFRYVSQYRKTVDSLNILEIAVSIWVISNTPFTKAFLERWGQKAADASFSLLRWAGQTVAKKLGERSRLIIATHYKGCRLEFVLAGNQEPAVVVDAMEHIRDAVDAAVGLVEALQRFGPERLTYGYNIASRNWLPLHATTRAIGVISDQPYLIAVDALKRGGFSVGGRRGLVDTNDANDSSSG